MKWYFESFVLQGLLVIFLNYFWGIFPLMRDLSQFMLIIGLSGNLESKIQMRFPGSITVFNFCSVCNNYLLIYSFIVPEKNLTWIFQSTKFIVISVSGLLGTQQKHCVLCSFLLDKKISKVGKEIVRWGVLTSCLFLGELLSFQASCKAHLFSLHHGYWGVSGQRWMCL